MLFKRREKEVLSKRVRVALWPRRTWWRSLKYLILRVLRLTASPHVIAMGVAAGVFASFTPFLGFHFAVAFAICFFARGSYFAAATGTFFGNPLTFPIIWASVLSAGKFVLNATGAEHTHSVDFSHLNFDMIVNSFQTVWPLIKTMTIGSVIVGIPVSALCYVIVRQMAHVYQKSRLKLLTDRARIRWADRLDQQLQAEYEAGRDAGENNAPPTPKNETQLVKPVNSKAVL